jgi:hypothetical protein
VHDAEAVLSYVACKVIVEGKGEITNKESRKTMKENGRRMTADGRERENNIKKRHTPYKWKKNPR